MGWRHRISFLVLVLLTALPLSGPLCAALCDSAASATARHHGSGEGCEESTPPATDVRIVAVSQHDCVNHAAAIRPVATRAAERAYLFVAAIAVASPTRSTFTPTPAHAATVTFTHPPGTISPTTPLVLRV